MSNLKNIWKNMRLYLILVMIPAFIISFFVYEQERENITEKHRQTATLMLNIHRNQINYLIGETEARMSSMATALNHPIDQKQMKRILTDTYKKEPRFSALYLLSKDGDVMVSTLPVKEKKHLPYKSILRKAESSKKSVITDDVGSTSHNRELSIFTPVFDPEGHVTNFLLASIRIDYLKNIMNVLSPELYIKILNQKDQIVLTAGHAPPENETGQTVDAFLDQIDWKLEVYPEPVQLDELTRSLLLSFLSIFILLNILFLLIQYMLLKRRTKQERAQNEAQKLELIGTLAASTAHEIRNPLTGISGFIQLLQKKYKSEEDQMYFSVIEQEIKRINQIVSEFLVLGKPTAEQWKLNSMNEMIDEIMPIIHSEANLYNVEVSFHDPAENPAYVYCKKDHIKQVVLNVAKNSLESMKNGGKLLIKIEHDEQTAEIIVKDNGEGIPKEMMEKIFQPFVTSKEKGTGLGLVVCKRIISMYGGAIHIDSERHKGTTVTITLPISNEQNG
ncbi:MULTISPECIES: PAS domain-containing sensor histidine kinase [Bacillus]|uniref:PAS domain-containing sensor histidine kinase n=1 Tax=Bacillus TaxID=1386 RepID=UPI00158142E8|nr:PAS domain-containing sensor histidine kinase [Bacillus glycinifermentans]MBU8787171.1 two-component sensor histidine kinase [Bacillus glycinifermentans]NUJ17217.1 two-component sensor histidine kinase [Bacillus glycinifermentans]